MKKPLTYKQKQLLSSKKAALRLALKNNSNPDPESLSRSYGLSIVEVEQEIRSYLNGY